MTINRAPRDYQGPHDWHQIMTDEEYETMFSSGVMNLAAKQACVLEVCARVAGYSEQDMMRFISTVTRQSHNKVWGSEYGTNKIGFSVSLIGGLMALLKAAAWCELEDPERFARWEREYAEEEAREQAMLHGVQARNEARGYDLSAPDPCGHHCDSDCHCWTSGNNWSNWR